MGVRAPKGGEPPKCPTHQFSTRNFSKTFSQIPHPKKISTVATQYVVFKFFILTRYDQRNSRKAVLNLGFFGFGGKIPPASRELGPNFRRLHCALLMVKKIPNLGNRKWEIFGGHPKLWVPGNASNSSDRLGVMLQNNAKRTKW